VLGAKKKISTVVVIVTLPTRRPHKLPPQKSCMCTTHCQLSVKVGPGRVSIESAARGKRRYRRLMYMLGETAELGVGLTRPGPAELR